MNTQARATKEQDLFLKDIKFVSCNIIPHLIAPDIYDMLLDLIL